MQPEIDKLGGTVEPTSSYQSNLHSFMDEYSLVDIWRLRNNNKRQFTWRGHSQTGFIQSRLDFF